MQLSPTWARAAAALIGQGVLLLLGLGASIPIARGLGPSGKGDYAFVVWCATCVVLVLGWGWQSAIAAATSQTPESRREVIAFARRRLLPVAASLVAVSAVSIALGFGTWGLAALGAGAQIWGQPASGALLGQGRVNAYYAGLVAQSACSLSLLLLFWQSALGLTVTAAVLAYALGAVVAMLYHSGVCHAFWPAGSAGSRTDRPLSALARSAWSANLAAFVTYRLDVLLVRWLTGASGLGIYSTAVTVAELGRMAPNAATQAALRPIGQAPPGARYSVTAKHMRRVLAAGAVCMVAICALSPWAIVAAYGADFAPAVAMVLVLAPGVVILGIASVGASALNVSGLHRVTARAAWAGAGVAALAAAVLVPLLGVMGAAVASSISYSFQAALVWAKVRGRLAGPRDHDVPSA